eukprot:scaffold41651_cov68-Phaeocystis_antarctica.AAC.4
MGVAVELAPGDPTCPTACAPPAWAQGSRWQRAQRRLPRDCREISVEARVRNPSPSASNPSRALYLVGTCGITEHRLGHVGQHW